MCIRDRLKNVLNYKKPEFRIMVVALVAVLAVIIGLAANPRNRNRDNFPASLLKQRTEYVGDNSKVGGIITTLEYPENVEYASFELHTSCLLYTSCNRMCQNLRWMMMAILSITIRLLKPSCFWGECRWNMDSGIG